MATPVYMRAPGQHTCTRAAVFLLSRAVIKTRGCGTEPKVGSRGPRGHLHCVITAGSRRDNRCIQSSSYTQVCRHSHRSQDLCAHLVARSFLTRGWRESRLPLAPSFSPICRVDTSSVWSRGQRRRHSVTSGGAKVRLHASGRRRRSRSPTGPGLMGEEGKSDGSLPSFAFALLNLNHAAGATPRAFN